MLTKIIRQPRSLEDAQVQATGLAAISSNENWPVRTYWQGNLFSDQPDAIVYVRQQE